MRRQILTLAVLIVNGASKADAQMTAQRLTRPIEFWNPAWSPDGRLIAFESTLSGKYAIYTIRADGTDLRRVTTDTSSNSQPSWSPDGRYIAFSSDRASGHLDIHLMNADGSGIRRLTSLPGGGYYRSTFSPNGRLIAFQGRPDNRETRDRVYVIGTDGSGLRLLSDTSYGAEAPEWSPDGSALFFDQVPYLKRLWSEMGEGDLATAKAATRRVAIRIDGRVASPTPTQRPHSFQEAGVPPDARTSPDGRQLVYSKNVGGWTGLYLFDVATKSERLLTGGVGAGPIGYLRTAQLIASVDTFDTWTGPRDGMPATKGTGTWLLRTLRRSGGLRWELTSAWYDSANRVTALQTVRTAPQSLTTEHQTVRADVDSASLLVNPNRVTGWAVPHNQPPRLFDGPQTGDRFAEEIAAAAIARSRPAVGQVFMTTTYSLYGSNPLDLRVDSMRVTRRDTLYRNAALVPVIVLEKENGARWVDEITGVSLVIRGMAGRERWWWHIRRGVEFSR